MDLETPVGSLLASLGTCPWTPRAGRSGAGRPRRLVAECGLPVRLRSTPTGSTRRYPISERAPATPCSSSRALSRARVPGSSSAPKRSLTSMCASRAQSHILSQPRPRRTRPVASEHHQVIHIGRGQLDPQRSRQRSRPQSSDATTVATPPHASAIATAQVPRTVAAPTSSPQRRVRLPRAANDAHPTGRYA